MVEYRDLTDAELRSRYESDAGVFIGEGVHVIRRLVTSAYPVRSVLVTPRKFEALRGDLETVRAPVYVAEQAVMNRVAGFNIHRGAVASADRLPARVVGDVLEGAARVAVVEALTDQENLGLIFRNAAGLGLDAVLLCPRTCDPLYRRTVRVSMGHVLHVPHARFDLWPDGLEDLRRSGFTIVALTPGASATDIGTVDAGAFERVAVMIGSEGPGLSDAALEAADLRVRIPMAPGVDSLNVANAAAIAFFCLRT